MQAEIESINDYRDLRYGIYDYKEELFGREKYCEEKSKNIYESSIKLNSNVSLPMSLPTKSAVSSSSKSKRKKN
jgi:hypothetical protein